MSISNVRREAEEQQLSNIANYVLGESMQLLSTNPSENFNSTRQLELPSLIGNQRFWVQMANDSSKTWIEAGLGIIGTSNGTRVYVPSEVVASGTYISGSGPANLRSYYEHSSIHLTIEGGF
jgi:hypothetical protein